MSTLAGAHDFVVNNPQIIDQSHTTTVINNNKGGAQAAGLQALLEASLPEASHDSSARYPPPLCHPGTRMDYIEKLTQWGLNADGHTDRIVWLRGPAGVGKSAIAQTCAEALGDKLGASFFFSRPNNRDDPDRFFTSLSYQLAVKFQLYGDTVDRKLLRDPTLVKRSLPHQFYHLFIDPIQQLKLKGEEFFERVVIVDGLDECARAEAQVDIVKIVAQSARERSTPFLWIFLSRLEPHLIDIFDSPATKLLSVQIELTISREIDGEIVLYLTDKLAEIGRKHGLALPWPTEKDIWILTDLSAGLFVYAHTVVRFVGEEDSTGPADQLRAVLRLAEDSTSNGAGHPLSGLNGFYMLIMERVPPKKLQIVQWILLATRVPGITDAVEIANLLGLSEPQFRNACRSLHSVLTLDNTSTNPIITFYHTSFMDFLEDSSRSKQFCIWSECAAALWDRLLPRFDRVQAERSEDGYIPVLTDLSWQAPKFPAFRNCYIDLTRAFFMLVGSIHFASDPQRLKTLIDFDFQKASLLEEPLYLLRMRIDSLIQNIPPESKLIRPHSTQKLLQLVRSVFNLKPKQPCLYVIGRGQKKALLEGDTDNPTVIPYNSKRVEKLMRYLCKDSGNELKS